MPPLRFESFIVIAWTSLVGMAHAHGQATAPDGALSESPRISRQGLGLDPGALSYGGMIVPPSAEAHAATRTRHPGQLNFHGFLRAPMRVGIGSGDDVEPGGPHGVKLHTPPRVPDATYTDWQYTNEIGGPWTEMQFAYGDARVFGTVTLAAYNQSDAGFRDLPAQLGVNQAWVTINLPTLFGDRGGVLINVGSFSGGYGAAGRYDAGAYGTYLFGRTHTTGETVSAFYDLTPDFALQVEHGIGARLDVGLIERARPDTTQLPYPGPVQQLPTFLHHGHIGFSYRDSLRVALHALTAWTQASVRASEPDGRITSWGAEIKVFDTRWGSGFLGAAFLRAREASRVAGAIEALHSWEGWSFAENYLRNPGGTGDITSLEWDWTARWSDLVGRRGVGDGPGSDAIARVFGLYNHIANADSTAPPDKLKIGASLTYTPFSWFGISGRYDNVQPNLNDNTETFHVLSPRLLFHTDFVSNEEIVLQYTRYVIGAHTKLPEPWNQRPGVTPDGSVISLIATMWW